QQGARTRRRGDGQGQPGSRRSAQEQERAADPQRDRTDAHRGSSERSNASQRLLTQRRSSSPSPTRSAAATAAAGASSATQAPVFHARNADTPPTPNSTGPTVGARKASCTTEPVQPRPMAPSPGLGETCAQPGNSTVAAAWADMLRNTN